MYWSSKTSVSSPFTQKLFYTKAWQIDFNIFREPRSTTFPQCTAKSGRAENPAQKIGVGHPLSSPEVAADCRSLWRGQQRETLGHTRFRPGRAQVRTRHTAAVLTDGIAIAHCQTSDPQNVFLAQAAQLPQYPLKRVLTIGSGNRQSSNIFFAKIPKTRSKRLLSACC